jgi:uncharacterized membrane protein YbhN (UPF0104 family)
VRKVAFVAFKLSVAGLLVWLVLRKVDFDRAFGLVSGLPNYLAATILGLFLMQMLLSAWRWSAMSQRLAAAPLPFLPAFKFFMIAQFYNQALPSFIPGDAARVWGAARYSDIRRATLAVVIDRVVTLVVLLVLSALSLFLLGFGHHRVPDQARLAFSALLLAGLAFAALSLLFRRRILGLLPARVRDLLTSAGQSLRVAGIGWDMAGWLAQSVVIHGTNIAIVYCLGLGMHLPLSALTALATVPLVMVAALLPVTVNGWGVREGVMVVLLGNFAIGPTEAATLSVMFGLAQLVFGLAAGLFVLIPTPAPASANETRASVE